MQNHFRQHFLQLEQTVFNKPLVYFDNAATSLKPQSVIQSQVDFYQKWNTNTHSTSSLASQLTHKVENIRTKILNFTGADSDNFDLIFTSGATASVNLLTHGLQNLPNFWQSGDEILLTQGEHHANLLPFQRLAKSLNLKLKFIPVNSQGVVGYQNLPTLLTPKTKLVAFSQISNLTGIIYPIQKIIKQIRQTSKAIIAVDGTQAVAHLQLNLSNTDPDFYFFSGHKMFAPFGIGALIGKKTWLDKFEPYQLGGEMVESAQLESATFRKSPYKFEAGTINLAGIIGLDAAIDFLTKISFEKIQENENRLRDYFLKQVKNFDGMKIYPKDYSKNLDQIPLFSFEIEKINNLDLATFLDLKGIIIRNGKHCTHPLLHQLKRENLIRASLSFFNTPREIDYFFEILKISLNKLR